MHNRTFLVVLVVTFLAGQALMVLQANPPPQALVKQETAYERVMRSGVLRCGYIVWPRLTERDPATGKMSGLFVDVTEEIGKKYRLKIEWAKEVFYGQQVAELQSGKVDAICGAEGNISFATGAYVDFSKPLAYYPTYAFTRRDESRFRELEGLNQNDVRFSALDGDISAQYAVEYFPHGKLVGLPQGTDPALVMRNVVDGKADIVIMDEFSIQIFNRMNGNPLRKVSSTPLGVFTNNFSVAKGEIELVTLLNQGIDLVNDMGLMEKIAARHNLDDSGLILPRSQSVIQSVRQEK